MSAESSEGFIPPHGGYAGLLAYQKALIVFQGTVRFCERFLGKRDRTVDQMIQAARSGKQNIVEGSKIWGTSKEAEIKLLNVSPLELGGTAGGLQRFSSEPESTPVVER